MNCRILEIDKQTWRFEEEGVRFFLLAGNRKALLIDSGMQVHNARELAEKLTDLPIELINTHCDMDHIASNCEFSVVYMNPAETVNYAAAVKSSDIIPVRDGQQIDLGDRILEVIEIPGHTPGSIALLDRGRRVLFSGDTVQDGQIFLFGPMRSIPSFCHSLKRLEAMMDRFDTVYPSHGSFPADPSLISGLVRDVQKLEAGKLEWEPGSFMGTPLKKYKAQNAVFLCDENYGE